MNPKSLLWKGVFGPPSEFCCQEFAFRWSFWKYSNNWPWYWFVPPRVTISTAPPEMRQIAKWIADVLTHPGDAAVAARIKGGVTELCKQYPAPAEE